MAKLEESRETARKNLDDNGIVMENSVILSKEEAKVESKEETKAPLEKTETDKQTVTEEAKEEVKEEPKIDIPVIPLTPEVPEAPVEPITPPVTDVQPQTPSFETNYSQNDNTVSQIANIAAKPITQTDATFVIPTTDVFSPYVVFAGPPSKPANNVANPSPIKVLSNPGSFNKSLPIIVPSAVWSPICSAIVTNAIGAIVKSAEKLGI